MYRARLSMREAAAQAVNLREVGEPIPVNFTSIATEPDSSLASIKKSSPHVNSTPLPAPSIDPPLQPAPSIDPPLQPAPSIDPPLQPAPSIDSKPQLAPFTKTPQPAPPIDQTTPPAAPTSSQLATTTTAPAPSATTIPSISSTLQPVTVNPNKKRPAPERSKDKPDHAIPSSKKARNELSRSFGPFQPTASSRKHVTKVADPSPPSQFQHRDSRISSAESTQTQNAPRSSTPSLRSAWQPLGSVQTTPPRSEITPHCAQGYPSYTERVSSEGKKQVSYASAKDIRLPLDSSDRQAHQPQKDAQQTRPGPSQRHREAQRGQTQASFGEFRTSQAPPPVARSQAQIPQAASLSYQREGGVSPWEEACRNHAASRKQTQGPHEQDARLASERVSADPRLEAFLRKICTNLSSFLQKFGLLVVDPGDGDTFTWVACKFCPTFHCKTRRDDYILMHRTPFSEETFKKHLVKEHPKEWNMYRHASSAEKEAFFDNHPLPPRETFMKRLLELRKSWAHLPPRGSPPGKGTNKNAVSSEVAPDTKSVALGIKSRSTSSAKQAGTPGVHTRSHTCSRLEVFGIKYGEFSLDEGSEGSEVIDGENTDYPLVSCDEMWAGRHRFQEVSSSSQPATKAQKGNHNRTTKNTEDRIYFSSVFLRPEYIVPEILQLVLHGVLSDKNVRPASAKIGLLYPFYYDISDRIPEIATCCWDEAWMVTLSRTVLFYLLRGVPLDIINEMLIQVKLAVKGEDCDEFEKFVDAAQDMGPETKSESGMNEEHYRFKGEYKSKGIENGRQWKDEQEAVIHHLNNMDVKTREPNDGEEDEEKVLKQGPCQVSEKGDEYEEKEELDRKERIQIHLPIEKKDVWNCGNSICAEALRLLRQLHEEPLNWAFCLATRRCDELGDGAVEVLIQTATHYNMQMWVHLVALRKEEGAADAVRSMLECAIPRWQQRLVGLRSGLNTSDLKEKVVERRIVEMLRKEEGVEEGFSYMEDGRKGMKIIFAEMTGVELVEFIRLHGMRYARMGGNNIDKEEVGLLKSEEETLMRVSGKLSYSLDEAKAMEKIQQMAPESLLMMRRLKRVWEFGLDEREGGECRGDQLGWFESKKGGEGVVDVLLERILFARELVKLGAVVEPAVNSTSVVIIKKLLTKQLEEARMWGRNWS